MTSSATQNTDPMEETGALIGRAWWQGAAIYQIYPRSFADSNGDGIGDLPGITAHLGHIASLGVAGIWLSPFFTSPMKDFGYDISDYCDVDSIFGTLADFDRLVERAHELNLKVVIDQVFSHTSDRHPWFQESRSSRDNERADWYVWADPKEDGSPPSNWQSVFGGPAWAWDARRGQYYLHNFLTEQPDLNVHSAAVQDALLRCARFWLDRGVDGFRLDAINFAMHDPALRDNPPAPEDGYPRTRPCDFQVPVFNKSHEDIPRFIERIRELTDEYADRFTVAEVGGTQAEVEMKRFTGGTKRFHSAYGFNFLYADRLTPALVEQAVTAWPDVTGTGWPSWAFSNHDAPRAVTRWASAEHRAAMARATLLLLACMRGNIFIYQGEELGLPQAQIAFDQLRDPEAIANWPLTLGRDGARTPIPWTSGAPTASASSAPWLPIVPEHLALAVDSQERDPDSQLAYTRRVLALRNRHQALTRGTMQVLEASGDILAFVRNTGGQQLLCVFNLGAETHAWQPPAAAQWRIIERTEEFEGWKLPPLSGLVSQRSA
ncbi:MAG TPA: alpha-glucosidase [Steroidobacteraceae bacterium]|nr:alpha-glucosidase [Steroidobacteraceae bacterium]